MVTPLDAAGAVDGAAVARLLGWFRSSGCKGVVLAGTNGEGPSLGTVEKRDLTRLACSLSEGLKVVLGIATSSLDEAVWLGTQAHKAGATALLVMPPSYFREAGQTGIALWFEALMNRVSIPVIVYNFPKRTGFALEPETLCRLADHERMLGIKDSSSSAPNIKIFPEASKGKELFVGDETLLMEALENGWTGSISGAANVLPNWLSAIVSEFSSSLESSQAKFEIVLPAIESLRGCPQPFTNKHALKALGILPSDEVRLPLMRQASEAIQAATDLILSLQRPAVSGIT